MAPHQRHATTEPQKRTTHSTIGFPLNHQLMDRLHMPVNTKDGKDKKKIDPIASKCLLLHKHLIFEVSNAKD